MYEHTIDTPCERDIVRIVSPIDFKFDLLCHTTKRTEAIDFGPSAKNKMAAIELLKYMYCLKFYMLVNTIF